MMEFMNFVANLLKSIFFDRFGNCIVFRFFSFFIA
jgi:hypothetical protein